MYKALDEKDLNQYRKYVKEKLAALPSLLTHVSPQSFPEKVRSSIPDGDLVALYTGVQGLAEAVYESLEQKIEELSHGREVFQERSAELSQLNTLLQTELTALKESQTELQQQNSHLAGLQDTALALMNCLEPAHVLETVLQRALELLGAPHGYICLLIGEIMEIKAGVGIYQPWIGSQKKWGEGLAGKVWQTGLPLVVSDYPVWPDRELNLEGDEIRAVLGAPLKAGAEVIGIIGLAYEAAPVKKSLTAHVVGPQSGNHGLRPGEINDASAIPADSLQRTLEVLVQFARMASTALGNLHVSQETQSALSRAAFLYEASAEFSHAQTYDDILAILRLYTSLGENASHIAVNLFDHPWTEARPAEWISVLAWHDQRTWITPRSHYRRADFPCFSQLLQPNTPVFIENILTDPRLDEATRTWYSQSLAASTALFIPLVAGAQWIGYLSAACALPTAFSEAEIRRLMILMTGPAAVAVQNLRRLQDIQAHAYREHLTREITAKISSSMDLETILKITARTLSQALGTSHALIRLGSLPPPASVIATEPKASRDLGLSSGHEIPSGGAWLRTGDVGLQSPVSWETQTDLPIPVKETLSVTERSKPQ